MGRMLTYILLGTLIAGLITFVITYWIGSNWKSTIAGRYLMYFMVTIAATFIYILAYPIVNGFPGKIYLDITILLLMNFGAWKLTWLLNRIQRGKYKDEDIR